MMLVLSLIKFKMLYPNIQKFLIQKKKLKKHEEARHFWVCGILIYSDIPIFLYQLSGFWWVVGGWI